MFDDNVTPTGRVIPLEEGGGDGDGAEPAEGDDEGLGEGMRKAMFFSALVGIPPPCSGTH